MKQTKYFMFGRTPDSHKAVGMAVGFDGQYDTTCLIENERCLRTRLDLWECSKHPLDRLEEIVKGLRKKKYIVGLVEKTGAKPYREIRIASEIGPDEVRERLEKHAGRAKGKAAVEAIKRLRELEKKRKGRACTGVR